MTSPAPRASREREDDAGSVPTVRVVRPGKDPRVRSSRRGADRLGIPPYPHASPAMRRSSRFTRHPFRSVPMAESPRPVALVTGAAVGIGRATALAFARAGTAVAVADILADEGAETVRQCEAAGARAIFVRCDVSSDADLAASVAATLKAFGRLDAAVNNAGIEQSGQPIESMDMAGAERVFAVNVRGVLLGMKHQIPALRKSGGGSIVNLSSIAGQAGFPGAGAYVASKHAVIGLTRTAALELAKDRIRVNAVCPGAIQTDMIDRFAGRDAATKADLIAHHPLGRIGTVDEVASAILWLCSPGAGFVTGQTVTVDGGYMAR